MQKGKDGMSQYDPCVYKYYDDDDDQKTENRKEMVEIILCKSICWENAMRKR